MAQLVRSNMRTHSKLWLSSVLVVIGCGGSTGNSTVGPVPKDEFASRLASAICDNIGACCQSAGLAYDAASCKSLLTSAYQSQLVSDKASYDATVAGQCVSWAANVATSCGSNPDPGPCDGVFNGTVPAGGACTASADCLKPPNGHVYCEQQKCVEEPRGMQGDACGSTCTEQGTSTSCSGGMGMGNGSAACYTNDGVYCASSGTCEKLAAVGASCTEGGCVAGAWCDWQTSTCAATVPAGSACSDSSACQTGSYCDSTSGKCVAAKSNGQTCQMSSECASDKCSAGQCVPDTIASAQICSGKVK